MEYVIRDSALNWKHINTFQLPEVPAETRKGPIQTSSSQVK